MGEIKLVSRCEDGSGEKYFDPMSIDGITPRCCCGYELIKESEDTLRCTGGNHRYHMKDCKVCVDKFGATYLEYPIPEEVKNENKDN